jgi:1-acyl-sn-glycerol-3-phosphate acyltransferase
MYKTLKGYTYFLTRIWLPLLRIYSIKEISGQNPKTIKGSIIVANHRGRLDALLLLSMLEPTAIVIKSKYTKIPIYLSFVKLLDFISINQDSYESLNAATAKCKEVLKKGLNVLIFPEGTRANPGKILPFKPFAFKLAIEEKKEVIPVVIHSGLPFMAKCKGSIFPKRHFNYTVRFLESQKPLEGESAIDFAYRIQLIIERNLKELDKKKL